MYDKKSPLDSQYKSGLVSVIIPTFNRQDMLLEALDSVFQQTYRPIQIIVVDDASTDNTRSLVTAFSAQHQSSAFTCKYLYQKNRNASLCRNFGLEKSEGEYIQFLDSDDILHPEKFEKQVTKIRDDKLDFVWSSTVKFEKKVDWNADVYIGLDKSKLSKTDLILDFINKSQWRTESGLFTRDACTRTGCWANISMFQDWEYHIRLLSLLPETAFVPGSFSAARQHQQGRIGDGWQSGSGLSGALTALKNITYATSTPCQKTSEWNKAISDRGIEIEQQALNTGYPVIVEAASVFVKNLRDNSVV
jgi:glycosyltransferase involved in cell wall biosynthesis